MELPGYFCWTRCGTEAGQSLEYIVQRKEQEREANKGLFLWGIGNAIGPSIQELLRRTPTPEVLFSPIKGPARLADESPGQVVYWSRAETLDGRDFALPPNSLVTSRQDASKRKRTHYALVCASDCPLEFRARGARIAIDQIKNILSGARVGASQVTAVVGRGQIAFASPASYDILFRAHLVTPYFIRLREPVPVAPVDMSRNTWSQLVQTVWHERRASRTPDVG